MRKILTILSILDGIICIVSFILLIYENHISAVGMTIMSSVGRWIVYGLVFINTAVILVVLVILMIFYNHKNNK